MIYLLDRNQIISHSVNKSEIHPSLSEIAKLISRSIYRHGSDLGHVTSIMSLNVNFLVSKSLQTKFSSKRL